MPWGPGMSQGQDYCRDISFHRDLRSADIFNSSQGSPTVPSLLHPTAVWALCCSFSLRLDSLSTPPCPHLGSEGPRTACIQAPWLSVGFGQWEAPAEWEGKGERGCVLVPFTPALPGCGWAWLLSAAAIPQLCLLTAFSFRPRVVTTSCSCSPRMLHYGDTLTLLTPLKSLSSQTPPQLKPLRCAVSLLPDPIWVRHPYLY